MKASWVAGDVKVHGLMRPWRTATRFRKRYTSVGISRPWSSGLIQFKTEVQAQHEAVVQRAKSFHLQTFVKKVRFGVCNYTFGQRDRKQMGHKLGINSFKWPIMKRTSLCWFHWNQEETGDWERVEWEAVCVSLQDWILDPNIWKPILKRCDVLMNRTEWLDQDEAFTVIIITTTTEL